MKKSILYIVLAAFLCCSWNCNAQLLENAKKLVTSKASGYTEKDAVDAIKEALGKGTDASVKLVSAKNGYFSNPSIKIPFPPDAKVMEKKLRSFGFDKKVDEVIVTLNRAAEDAAKDAGTIFLNAIKNMSVSDGISIVKGDNNAATQFLKKNTSADLKAKFLPIIKVSLDKVYATKYWGDLVKLYNKIPGSKKMNPNLPDYVTDKAIEGLFIMIAAEELKIRKDPVAQTTDLLKKVFGN